MGQVLHGCAIQPISAGGHQSQRRWRAVGIRCALWRGPRQRSDDHDRRQPLHPRRPLAPGALCERYRRHGGARLRRTDAGLRGHCHCHGLFNDGLCGCEAARFPDQGAAARGPMQTPDLTLWAQGVGAWGKINGDGNAAKHLVMNRIGMQGLHG